MIFRCDAPLPIRAIDCYKYMGAMHLNNVLYMYFRCSAPLIFVAF